MAFIYVITNDVNGKQYVGKTLHDSIEKRFKEHLNDSHKERCEKRPLYMAIRKYGEKHFSIKALEENVDPKVLSEREAHWINELGTFGHGGYNITHGGDGKQLYDYEEIKDLLLSGMNTDEVISRIGCCLDVISYVRKHFNLKRGNDLLKKPVDQLSLNDELLRSFDSATSAGKWIKAELKVKNQHPDKMISDCVEGKRLTAYGFRWRFHNESDRPSHN